ncbi:Filament-like plant protein [Macleaya cordata]|uniref:Filament-like plant protein n=1 Tax=Macleaya cordata TaxID=56857 RepID=A0A200QQV2_MACCD|nr:Filament-like plant protein [Macleaya cordata]
MDRRSWPWKKKQSDKTVATPDLAVASLASAASQGEQDISKKVNYVQISLESYTHLTELEEEVKTLHDQVNVLNENLSVAHSEITTKENLVKQHSKVAEDAVSGWEKAEAEALALKLQLESVTLLKLTAEDRASHLDGALKECMKQVRNLKEEHEQKLHETVLTKTRQCDKIKLELKAKIDDLNQELLRSSAENAALSRSLQERSAMLMNISEEKSQAEADIEHLKSNIQSYERDINSLKYEVHVVSKELEIRNEEKNMSMRSAEVASKQHLEGVKKIAKLEAECQRLRGLVRKKLPGPAALAQMKLEVEHLGRDYGETRIRRSPVKSFNPHLGSLPEFSLDNVQQCHKETEFLAARLLATEEETKMLKEALATRNSELQASRNMFAKAASKLRDFEAQLQVLNHHKNSRKLNVEMSTEGSLSQNASNPPSLTSISEDGIDEEGSSAEGLATALMSELSHFKKEKHVNRANKVDNPNHVELMDDFLEMERLACSSTESCGAISIPGSLAAKRTDNGDHNPSIDISQAGNLLLDQQPDLDASANLVSSNEMSGKKAESDTSQVSISKLQSRISMIFESEAKGADIEKVLVGIKRVVQDIQDVLPPCSVSSNFKETHSADATSNQQACLQPTGGNMESGISLIRDSKPGHTTELIIDQELSTAVSQIHDFVVSLGKDAIAIQDSSLGGHGLRQGIEEFSDSVSKVLCRKMSLVDFLLGLSQVLAKVGELSISVLGYKGIEGEINSSDCIDKVTLLENNVVQSGPLREKFPNDCPQVCHSTSDTEVLQEGILSPALELEELKSEKETMAMELARHAENLEQTKLQLQETEQLVAELKSQLAASQKSNSLTETQLKCMAESYKSLETRAQVLETEVNLLHAKLETLNNELQEEKQNHEDALAKCKDLQEQLQRSESCSTCALSSAADTDINSKQEKKIAAATEKLAECQETIFLLGKQLKALRPSVELTESLYNEKRQMNENLMEDLDHTELENVASPNLLPIEGCESPSHVFNSPMSPSDTEANLILRSPISSKHPKHRPTKSSSSSSPGLTPEKNSRSFSRFFSSKSKSGH